MTRAWRWALIALVVALVVAVVILFATGALTGAGVARALSNVTPAVRKPPRADATFSPDSAGRFPGEPGYVDTGS